MLQYIINNPEAFAQNLAKTLENAGKALAAYIEPREKGEITHDSTDELTGVIKTLAQVGEYWISDPQRAVEAQSRLWTGYIELWNSSLKRMMGETAAPAVIAPPRDKRFADPDWNENQFFDFIKQLYLITSKWAEDMVLEAEELDEHTRHKAEFYVKQISNAISPSNFVLTNPELLRLTMESNGANLVKGMQHLAEDIKAGRGDVKIRQTDPTKFQLGVNLGVTPGKVIAENDVCQVIQYAPATDQVLKRPLMIVPPWINKFYILDLQPENSFIRWAVDRGHTVFVISWVNPGETLRYKRFEGYMHEGILEALDAIEAATGESRVNAIGYCIGGTLLAGTLAWMKAMDQERIASATFFTAQVDFEEAGELRVFIDEPQLKGLEKRMKKRGYLDGEAMSTSFNLLRANDLIWTFVVNNYLLGRQPPKFDLLYWNSDFTRLPETMHLWYLRNMYLENRLVEPGGVEMGGVPIDLSTIDLPIYIQSSREDHIAPYRSVYKATQIYSGEVTFMLAGSGHIAGVINPPAAHKYGYWTNPELPADADDWIEDADYHEGSWWGHWNDWLRHHAGRRIKARVPGDGALEVIEPAPGSYVRG